MASENTETREKSDAAAKGTAQGGKTASGKAGRASSAAGKAAGAATERAKDLTAKVKESIADGSVQDLTAKVKASITDASKVVGEKARIAATRTKEAASTATQTASERVRAVKGEATASESTASESTASESTASTERRQDDEVTADTGTGPLEKRTVAQLRNRASELGIEGRASMRKAELVAAIRDAS